MKRTLVVVLLAVVMLAGCGAREGAGGTSGWSITVTSAAGTKTLTMADLKALPQTEVEFGSLPLECLRITGYNGGIL